MLPHRNEIPYKVSKNLASIDISMNISRVQPFTVILLIVYRTKIAGILLTHLITIITHQIFMLHRMYRSFLILNTLTTQFNAFCSRQRVIVF